MRHPDSQVERDCCRQLFFAHYIDGNKPLVVLECTRCGRLWHRREDGVLIPYDRVVKKISRFVSNASNRYEYDFES